LRPKNDRRAKTLLPRSDVIDTEFFVAFSSLLIHAYSGQLLVAVMVTASFLAFIPFKERQLIKSREDEYPNIYIRRTLFRIFRGMW
jgi:hypothetical protein